VRFVNAFRLLPRGGYCGGLKTNGNYRGQNLISIFPEQILDAMERRGPEVAGVLIARAYEDHNACMLQTLKKAALENLD